MKELRKEAASVEVVGEEAHEQRIDNFLLRRLKGVPKSHVYRILRTGQVRVNSGRVDATYRLQAGDRVRLPPLRLPAPGEAVPRVLPEKLGARVIHEDDALIVLDKPCGMAVHGGSGISLGLIERLRLERPEARFLELVHRLDRETSGLLLVARRRPALTALHAMLREGRVQKRYLVLVRGKWQGGGRTVDLPLHKGVGPGGERHVSVRAEGARSVTHFRPLGCTQALSLLEAHIETGRTHQIRVQLAHVGHPVAGDSRYGDFDWNKELARQGLKRMFLHAWRLSFDHPSGGARLHLCAPLPEDLRRFLGSVDLAGAVPAD
jgi:23S rRNA pseudouridine955/2504/2580 synthase